MVENNVPRRGLIAAAFTPMNAAGEVDFSRMPAYAEWLAAAGVAGVFVNGTTAESQSLSVAERLETVAHWAKAARGKLPIVVHVGCTALPDARVMAEHAQRVGAAGIAAHSPYFFKPRMQELVGWCSAVAAAAPALPFYYYQIPAMTGVALPVAEFVTAARSAVKTLAGIKFTYEDLMDLQNVLQQEGERLNVLFGRDEILLAGLTLGCEGAVGSTYNFAAPVFHRVVAAHARGDRAEAQRQQSLGAAFITVMSKHGGLSAGKAMMKMVGFECGPCRLPMRTLTENEYGALREALTVANFFTHCAK